jgi:hypothetical protein
MWFIDFCVGAGEALSNNFNRRSSARLQMARLMAIQRQNRIALQSWQSQYPRFCSRAVQSILVLLAVSIFSGGCMRLASTIPDASTKQLTQSSRLIKVLPKPDSPADDWRQSGSIPARQGGPVQSEPHSVRLASRASSAEDKEVAFRSEESQVKVEARELAKRIGSIERIKMCYVDEDDEWWATFYQDIGSVIDVKQFIWNRESQRFEPFLVLKRISKSKLTAELNRNEKGRHCAVVSPPEKVM